MYSFWFDMHFKILEFSDACSRALQFMQIHVLFLKEKGKGEGYLYDCELLQLFELGSITNHYYLVNIRLPVNFLKGYNVGIGKVVDISIHVNVLVFMVICWIMIVWKFKLKRAIEMNMKFPTCQFYNIKFQSEKIKINFFSFFNFILRNISHCNNVALCPNSYTSFPLL